MFAMVMVGFVLQSVCMVVVCSSSFPQYLLQFLSLISNHQSSRLRSFHFSILRFNGLETCDSSPCLEES
ncbi:hypothetical protein BT69DRAFT_101957 [Atractiella rhizophila]|nr:hypothetical protein BT69DRAFT_101957 [Atractiella rhizophila]